MTPNSNLRGIVEEFRAAAAKADVAINLVPSENRLSPLARIPLSSDFYNRYFFNDSLSSDFWQFRGGQLTAELEVFQANRSLEQLSRAEFVNLRPISGMSAMMIAMGGLGGAPGGTIVSIASESGGHYATADVARRLGFVSVTVPAARGYVDEQCLGQVLRDTKPVLIYLDLQNSRHQLQTAQVAMLIERYSPQTLLHVDVSHTLGLVLGGAVENPLDAGAHAMGGSTHKSFPGPHKGVLFTRSAILRDRLRDAQFIMLSSHHFAETLALGLAATEFLTFGPAYSTQVITNARLLGKLLALDDFDVVIDDDGHCTSTHQVWINVGDQSRTNQLSAALNDHGIRVNIQVDLPGVPGPVFRLGLSEVTFMGGREDTVRAIAEEFHLARAGERRDGYGSRRVLDSFGPSYFYSDLSWLDVA